MSRCCSLMSFPLLSFTTSFGHLIKHSVSSAALQPSPCSAAPHSLAAPRSSPRQPSLSALTPFRPCEIAYKGSFRVRASSPEDTCHPTSAADPVTRPPLYSSSRFYGFLVGTLFLPSAVFSVDSTFSAAHLPALPLVLQPSSKAVSPLLPVPSPSRMRRSAATAPSAAFPFFTRCGGFTRQVYLPCFHRASHSPYSTSLSLAFHYFRQAPSQSTHFPLFSLFRLICPSTSSFSCPAAESRTRYVAGTDAASTRLPIVVKRVVSDESNAFRFSPLGLPLPRRLVTSTLPLTLPTAAASELPSTKDQSPVLSRAQSRDLFSQRKRSYECAETDACFSSWEGSDGGGQTGLTKDPNASSSASTSLEGARNKVIRRPKKTLLDNGEKELGKGGPGATSDAAHNRKEAEKTGASHSTSSHPSAPKASASTVKERTACGATRDREKTAAIAGETQPWYGTNLLPANATETQHETFLAHRGTRGSLVAPLRRQLREELELPCDPPVVNRSHIGEQRRLDRRLNWFKQYPYAPEAPTGHQKERGAEASGPSALIASAAKSVLPPRPLPRSLRWKLLAETPAPAAAVAAAAAAASQAATGALASIRGFTRQKKSKKRLKKLAAARAAVAAAAAAQKAPGSAALLAAADWLHSAQMQRTTCAEGALSVDGDSFALSAKAVATVGRPADRGIEVSTPGASSPSPRAVPSTELAATGTATEIQRRGKERAYEPSKHLPAHGRQADDMTLFRVHASPLTNRISPGREGEVQQPGLHNLTVKSEALQCLSDVVGSEQQERPSLLSLLYPSKHAAYPPQLAFFVMKQLVTAKFNESVELHVRLNMGGGSRGRTRATGSIVGRVKGYVTLPHGEVGELLQLARGQKQDPLQGCRPADTQGQQRISRVQEKAVHHRRMPTTSDLANQPERQEHAADAEDRREQEGKAPNPYREAARLRQQHATDSTQVDRQLESPEASGEGTTRGLLPVLREFTLADVAGKNLPDSNIRDESGIIRGKKKGGLWRRPRVIAAFVDAADEKAALQAGANIADADKILSQIQNDAINFDVLISTPDMVARLSRYGKTLGPKDLLPQDAWGTLSADFCGAIRLYRQTTVPYKSDKFNIVHMPIGHTLMSTDQLVENMEAAIHSLQCLKPSSAGLNFLSRVHISSTMGPGILVDMKHTRPTAGGTQRAS